MAGPADAGAVVSPDAVEAIGKHGAGERKTGKRSGEEGTSGDGGGDGACGAGVRVSHIFTPQPSHEFANSILFKYINGLHK